MYYVLYSPVYFVACFPECIGILVFTATIFHVKYNLSAPHLLYRYLPAPKTFFLMSIPVIHSCSPFIHSKLKQGQASYRVEFPPKADILFLK